MVNLTSRGVSRALLALFVAGTSFALPSPGLVLPTDQYNQTVEKRSIEGGVTLNIMPTGASITFGINSSDGNGYRKDLYDLLTGNGNPVNYIGTQHGGTMIHNANEGYPGKRIGQVADIVLTNGVLKGKPNIVLINLGTNDCVQNFKVHTMPDRMSDFLTNLHAQIPNSVFIVSSLLPNRKASVEACVNNYNAALPGVVAKAKQAGQKAFFVDMHAAVPLSDISTKDGTHPNDAGYDIMAQKWQEAIAGAAGQISGPHS